MLAAEALSVGHRGRAVLAGVSLALRPGEVLALLGPNGGGKTTLLRTLLGLIPPVAGRVVLDGKPIGAWRRREVARRLAYVPQAAPGGFAFSARDAVAMGRAAHLSFLAVPGPRDRAAAEAALARLSIGHLAARPVTELSGGERQLVLVARALAQDAACLVLDEPTASLDFGNQARVLREVRLLADSGLAVLMTTHQPDHAFLVADRVALLHGGAWRGVGRPGEMITEAALREAYGVEARIGALDGRPVVAPVIRAGG